MSTNKTPNLNLHSWVGTDYVKRDEFNDNFNILDTKFEMYIEEVDATTKDPDAGLYKTVNYKRPDTTLYMSSVLSGKNLDGYYETDTWTIYLVDGITVNKTITWSLTYDADGLVTNKSYTIS